MSPELDRALNRFNGETLQVVGAQYHRKTNRLVTAIASTRLLEMEKMQRLEQELQAMLPDCKVEAEFRFPQATEALEDYPEESLRAISGLWGELIPAARPFLQCAKFELREDSLNVLVPENVGAHLFSPKTLERVEQGVRDTYGLELRLDVCQSDEVKLTLAKDMEKKEAPQPLPHRRDSKGKAKPEGPKASDVLYGRPVKRVELVEMDAIREDSGRVCVAGTPLMWESRPTKGGAGKDIVRFTVTDYTNTLPVKLFSEQTQTKKFLDKLEEIQKAGDSVLVRGDCYLDQYSHELCIQPLDINRLYPEKRMDKGEDKRVELHLHTQMSSMDGLTKVKDAINTAAKWGHKAIAITDHGVVQAFPEATKCAKKAGIKLLFGLEGYLITDAEPLPMDTVAPVAVALDLMRNKLGQVFLLEIAAAKQGESGLERFHTLVDPGITLPDRDGTEETLSMEEALRRLNEFAGQGVLLTDAAADVAVLYENMKTFRVDRPVAYVELCNLGHHLLPKEKDVSFSALLAHYSLAVPQKLPEKAEAMFDLYAAQLEDVQAHGSKRVPVSFALPAEERGRGHNARHIILIARTQQGLYNMYHLVSIAHLEYFRGVPRIPKSALELYREGIILGSACEAGELFRAMVAGAQESELERIAQWYDYLEVQPIGNNAFMIREGTAKDEEALRDYNRRIVALGEKLQKPVVATGDVHFLEPKDARYRAILMYSRGFTDAEEQAPLYFKTTDEMLEEFSYLGQQKAHELVVDAPNAIADLCDELKPYPDGTYAPVIEGAEENLKNMAMTRAHEIYGDPLPPVVQARLDKELNSIITHGFASLYMMAQRLVQKSLGDGYLVGSRGSVGSSLVANMAGITEVNSLQAHYVCPKCKHSDFDVANEKSACGVDLPDACCPVCGTKYLKMGFEIPFEVFLGFHGDKTPDIDLNFSGEYQPVAHQYCEVMFGEGHAFRAGTIGAVQDKTVFGYLKNYCEEKNVVMSRAEMERLAMGCSGVKRTTGQHPGGIVVVPADRDILEFTPVQYPADQKEKNTITTHFDFHALDDRLVKLDILGHDDPTALKMLHDLTGLNPRDIPLDDPPTMKMYSSAEPLGISLEAIGCDVGSLGIPEFGTHFVRGMLKDTRPTTMEELIRIAGLSHGTDVWLNNAQLLVEDGTATLSEVICTRDDIMNYLIAHGGEPSISFKTMESVRKGRGLTPEMEEAMRAIHVPEWFVDSCKKIKYMFPRAHAAAYVIMSFRIAYYKVHYPLAYYAVYYTVRADAFDIARAEGGAARVLENIRAIEKMGKQASNNDKDLLIILEVVYEMNLRGIELLPVDLYHSDATQFLIEDGAIRPPLSSVAGVGANAAVAIREEAQKGPFLSQEEFLSRTRANQAVTAALDQAGCFKGIPMSNQISLFSM